MVQRGSTVAFEGIEARAVDVQAQVAPGLPAFAMRLDRLADLSRELSLTSVSKGQSG